MSSRRSRHCDSTYQQYHSIRTTISRPRALVALVEEITTFRRPGHKKSINVDILIKISSNENTAKGSKKLPTLGIGGSQVTL
jgi:hypothetical protein